jgi:hypothetical protein
MSPNVEQMGLLRIDYESLTDLCADEGEWRSRQAALAQATPQVGCSTAT